jgi:hypothetical protein
VPFSLDGWCDGLAAITDEEASQVKPVHGEQAASDRVFEGSASYGEMSRRSGEAAEEDNYSDISPFDSLRSLTAGR